MASIELLQSDAPYVRLTLTYADAVVIRAVLGNTSMGDLVAIRNMQEDDGPAQPKLVRLTPVEISRAFNDVFGKLDDAMGGR